MSRAMVVFAAVSSIGVATLVQAQAQTPYGPDNGFFRPAPDVALTSPGAIQANVANPPYTQPYVTLQTPVPTPAPALATPAAPAPAMMTAAPAMVTPVPATVTPVPAAPMPAPAPAPVPPQAAAEQQMDRSVAEMDRDRTRMQAATPGVGAAFDGTTSDANR